ncbi:glutamine amidotransferase-related protein [Microbacterium sp. YY-01]|uniref:glutamine amidotransferase-related protein n=1 Tax=Microbacterium sp. YY-01 TaxID=3421634 RepID=UPI003D176DEC
MQELAYVGVRPERDAADAEYASFCSAMGLAPEELSRIDLVQAPLSDHDLQRHRGFVVGGSPFNVADADVSDLQRRVEHDLERIAERALDAATTAMFTCYGIGVLTRMLGGQVVRDFPEPASAATVTVTPNAAIDPVFGPAGPSFLAFTAHKEAAAAAPAGAVPLATNDACPVQAYRVGDTVYATQFHPEVTPADFAHRMTFYRSTGYFDPAQFEAVRSRVVAAAVSEPVRLLHRFARLPITAASL